MTICEDIGAWAADLRSEDLPEDVVARARLQAASIDAARVAGAEASARVAAAAGEGPVAAVYRSAAASIAHDWDDYLFMGHAGHSAVPAAAIFAPDPARALVAQVAANEVAGRLGAALFLGPHNGQFWASIHCAGAAVAAATALGLDAERGAHALAIALYQPPFGMWPGFMGPDSKLLTAAEPAAAGVRAALMAGEGMTGALDVIEHPRGVLASLAFASRPGMLGALGNVWLTRTLAFKPLPGCAYLQAAVDAALAADVDAAEVAAIDVSAGWLTCGMEELGRGPGLTAVRVNFSTALSIAVALTAGRLTHEELAPEWLGRREAELRALAARVRVRHDPELTALTIAGAVDAGASLGDLSLRDWLRVGRRAADAGMGDAVPGAAELRSLLGLPTVRGAVRRARRAGGGEIDSLDTSALRLTFPSRLAIRLRSGGVREVEGRERGACGCPLEEQRAVVAEKAASVERGPDAKGAAERG